MDWFKGLLGLIATIWIAAVVSYAISAPATVENFHNTELEALGGQTINEHYAELKTEADAMQCAEARRAADAVWENSIEMGDDETSIARMEKLDMAIERFCK